MKIADPLAVNTFSWLYGGRQLVFGAAVGSTSYIQLRALDVTGAGTDLMADSRALFTTDNPRTSACATLQITPDGGTAVCATRVGIGGNTGCANGGLRLTAFPLPGDASGKLVRVLYQYRGACHGGISFMLWTDASASSIIGVTAINEGGKEAYQVGVITGGRFRPLNIAKSVPSIYYTGLAF